MKYNCTIINISDDEVMIKIGEEYIVGFVNSGVSKKIGEKAEVDILLYDDLTISKSDVNETAMIRNGDSFSYSLFGILDIDNCVLKSVIDFSVDKEELYNYVYLDEEMVRIDVIRIDLYFE